jgi:hypothetical protein
VIIEPTRTYGAGITSIAGVLLTLQLCGALETKYQTKVRNSLRPLSSRRQHSRENELNLKADLRRVESLSPPQELLLIHGTVVGTMKEVIAAREKWLPRENTVSYSREAIARSSRLKVWRQLEREVSTEDISARNYVTELKAALLAFGSKQDMMAKQHVTDINSVIMDLKRIIPPRRREQAHGLLIKSLDRLCELIEQRRACIRDGDQACLERTAQELLHNEEHIKAAIKKIRRLL